MIIEHAELLSVGSLFMFCGDSKQSDMTLQLNLIMGKNSVPQCCGKRSNSIFHIPDSTYTVGGKHI